MKSVDVILILLSKLNPFSAWRNSSRLRPYWRRVRKGLWQWLGAVFGRDANDSAIPRKRPYWKNFLEATSQVLAATLLGTDPDLTFSAQVGRLQEAGHPRGIKLAPIIDFFWGENHCYKAWLEKV